MWSGGESDRGATSADGAGNREHDDGAEGGDHDAADVQATNAPDPEGRRDVSADHRADDAQDDRGEQSKPAADEELSDQSGNQSEDDPHDEIGHLHPPCVTTRM